MEQTQFTKEDVGKYYTVQEGDFEMIGIVGEDFHLESESYYDELRGMTTCTRSDERKLTFNTRWCYSSKEAFLKKINNLQELNIFN